MNTAEISKTTLPLTRNQAAIWLDDAISESKATYVIGGFFEIKLDLM